MTHRSFRFGVAVGGASSREEWRALARKIERQGYSTLQIPDHLIGRFSPAVALQAAAEATTTLRVGSIVFDNDFRHPMVLAKEVATLDVLTGGRVELGIGAGWYREEYEQAGIPFDPPAVRIQRLEESLQILKGLFGEEPVTFAGRYYTITGHKGLPKPVQKPHPPIFIGGGGKLVLTLAAQHADIIGIHYQLSHSGPVAWEERTEAALAQKVEWIRQAAGTRFEDIELNLLVSPVIITDDQQGAIRELIRERKGDTVSIEQVLDWPYALIGSVAQISEKLSRFRERYHISYITINEGVEDAFAPIITALS